MAGVAFVFPGQGAQGAGMLDEELTRAPEARDILACADEKLALPMSRLMTTGPGEALFDTTLAQPALLTVGVIDAWHLRNRKIEPKAVIGHSVGQFAALVTAGALDFSTALELVQTRARLMAEAMPPEGGAMAAILGADRSAVYAACAESGGVVGVACHNAPGQTVISGTRNAVETVADRLEDAGMSVVLLAVSVAAHSSLLHGAADQLTPLVMNSRIADPSIPVIDNVTARPLVDAAAVRQSILQQLTEPVLFEESVAVARSLGATTFVECGPADTLVRCIRRQLPDAPCFTFREAFANTAVAS
jgi:[acyl-carrier-protein] S-malonyltransferase